MFEDKVLWERTEMTNFVKKRKLDKAYSKYIIFSFFARRLSVDVDIITFYLFLFIYLFI
jgi:hypothetical protein